MWQTVIDKVLIIDDASFMRTLLKDIIKSNGLSENILEADNGVDGVKQYQQHKPDLVTLDVNMPRADGIQTLRAIMKINPLAKVIMVTSLDQKEIVQDSMKLGARDFIVKPFDRSNVPITLNKVMRQK